MTTPSVIDRSDKVPGAYIEVLLGVGGRSAADSPRKVLLYGNKTSAGTATVETIYQVASVDDARSMFGAGSELFLMCKAAFAVWPTAPLYAIAVTASGGTAASRGFAITGPATAAGTTTIQISGVDGVIEIPYASGDAQNAIAAAIEAKLDTITDLPVIASVSTNTVTLTARHAGPRGNDLRYTVTFTPGTGVSCTNGNTTLASGATSDDPQTALDVSAASRYHYHVSPYPDSTQNAKFESHVDANAVPTVGIREYFVFGSVDSLANTTTVSLAINSARGRVAWLLNAWDTPALLAARYAAAIGQAESEDPAANMDGTVLPGCLPPYNPADKPLHTEKVTALNNGFCPLSVGDDGTVAVSRAITNRSRDSAGNPDYTVLDLPKSAVPDYIADDLELQFVTEFTSGGGGLKLGADQAEDAEPTEPQDNVVTPAQIRDWVIQRLKQHEKDALIVNVDARLPELSIAADANVNGRVGGAVPVDVIEGFHQLALQVRQVA